MERSENDDFFCSFFSLLLDMGGQKLHGEDYGCSTDGHAINIVGAKLQYIMHVAIVQMFIRGLFCFVPHEWVILRLYALI